MQAYSADLLIHNIGALSTPVADETECGVPQVETVNDAYLVIVDGVITEVGSGSPPAVGNALDAGGRVAVPAFCDPHTHAVFAGWRCEEFISRLQGAGYKDILAAGGGILSTVRSTRAAAQKELAAGLQGRLDEMLSRGVLTCEVKSGYGLDVESELKMLRAIRSAGEQSDIDVVSTFLGAHAVPDEYQDDPAGYIDDVVIPLIDDVADLDLAEYVDVFCEPGVFDLQLADRVLRAGRRAGLGLRIHADEMEALGGAGLAAKLQCDSAEHLLSARDDDLLRMRDAKVTAVLLPGTAFVLGEPYARARWMIDHGLTVALGTDFNPGSCPIIDISLIMSLACLKMQMTPDEVLAAVTINAARSLGRDDRGILASGFRGDVVLLDAEHFAHLMYRPGASLVHSVISGGRQVYCRK